MVWPAPLGRNEVEDGASRCGRDCPSPHVVDAASLREGAIKLDVDRRWPC